MKNKKIKQPIKTFIVFDLSPVIKIAIKKIVNTKKLKNFEKLSFFNFEKIKPNRRNTKPEINAPEMGSSLKKLTTRLPSGCFIPSISTFPKPRMLAPVYLSK